MKTKLELPTITWRGRVRQPEIIIWKNRKTSHVHWSIYTLDNDYVLSEVMGQQLNEDGPEAVKKLGELFNEVRNDPDASNKAEQWSCMRWGYARYVPHAYAENLAGYMADRFVEAMEYCARNEAAILKDWGEAAVRD